MEQEQSPQEKPKRQPSQWVSHVQSYSKKKKLSYKDAMRDEQCKVAYQKSKELARKKAERENKKKLKEMKTQI